MGLLRCWGSPDCSDSNSIVGRGLTVAPMMKASERSCYLHERGHSPPRATRISVSLRASTGAPETLKTCSSTLTLNSGLGRSTIIRSGAELRDRQIPRTCSNLESLQDDRRCCYMLLDNTWIDGGEHNRTGPSRSQGYGARWLISWSSRRRWY